jgi:acetyl esterase
MQTTAPALDPAIADIERRWRESGIPSLYAGCNGPHGGPVSRERARNIRALLYPKPKLPTGNIERLKIAGPHGAIPLRIIWPHASYVHGKPSATLVYFHGGAWIVGDLDSHEMHAVRLANEAQCVVVNVDYRLAPEHKFPVPMDECFFATQWAHQNISQLGGNPQRLAVGGDSAGGNAAASVAVQCRDAGLDLAAQLLMYPATNTAQIGDPDINRALFGEHHASLSLDPRTSPYHAASHTGLAPAIIGVGPYDFFYQDNLAYAAVLRAAKVPLLWREYPTLNHGFFSYTAISKDSEAAALQLCHDLRTHFQR